MRCAGRGRAGLKRLAVWALAATVMGSGVTARSHAGGGTESRRGRTSAAAYARRHHAGTLDDQRRRRDRLADLGVGTIFLALPDLGRADDLATLRPLTSA